MSSSASPNDPAYDQPTAPLEGQSPYYQYPQSQYPQSEPPAYFPPGSHQPADQVVRSSDFGGAHAESRYSSYVDADGNIVERRQQVYHDANQQRANIRYWSTTVIYFLLSVLEVILGLRWLFRLLGANTDNDFISFLYGISHPFVAPFNGIFNDQSLGRQGVFEFSTLIAMLVYALIAWGLVALINLLFRPVPGTTDSTITTRRRSY
ncbi:MAG TPA: YggT family protein [Ktedonobacterales bacterium]|jgi:hypothetical protein